nr:hypothetical protein [Tanacetum cinerariifolium]
MEKARSNRYMSDLETFKISLQSKFDQTSKISKSVFISNFPDDCTSRDLWKVCNDYDTVVDVFIPNKKSKGSISLLFDSLRPKAPTFQKVKSVSSGDVTRFMQPNVQYHVGSNVTISTPPFLLKPTLVLDDSCLVNKDLVNCVMGEVLQFSSINNLRVLLSNEGFHNAHIVYQGGLWVMIELKSSKTKSKFM